VALLSALLAACGGGTLPEASALVVIGEADASAQALGARSDGSGVFTLAGFQLTPARAEVVVGRSLELNLVDCPKLAGSTSDETNVRQCKPVVVLPGELTNWAVNGVAGGSAAAGTVK
jgi:hypothetical protein